MVCCLTFGPNQLAPCKLLPPRHHRHPVFSSLGSCLIQKVARFEEGLEGLSLLGLVGFQVCDEVKCCLTCKPKRTYCTPRCQSDGGIMKHRMLARIERRSLKLLCSLGSGDWASFANFVGVLRQGIDG